MVVPFLVVGRVASALLGPAVHSRFQRERRGQVRARFICGGASTTSRGGEHYLVPAAAARRE